MRSQILIVPSLFLLTVLFPVSTTGTCTKSTSVCQFLSSTVQTYDGSCNYGTVNYGKTDTAYGRYLTAKQLEITPPFKSLFGQILPLPRKLSRDLFACTAKESKLNHLAANFGLFLMHDMFLTERNTKDSACCDACYGIAIKDANDPLKSCKSGCLPYGKPDLLFPVECDTGSKQMEGTNKNSHYIDASPIFGSSQAKFNELFDQGKTMKMSAGHLTMAAGKFLAGDDRINEQPLIMAVYHLFALEYNRIYNKLVQMKILTPEKKARRILIGVLQHITYKEFLPLLLGSTTLFSKNGAPLPYDKTLKPNVYNSFSVAYKMAIYSMLRDTYTGSQNTVVNMKDQWGKTTDVENKDKRDKLIEGMMKDASNAVDNNIACIFTNDCSTDKHEAKVDMVSDAIQDNRYLSLSVYVAWLALTKGASNIPTQFSELPYHSAEDKTKLQTSYQSVYDIDFMSAVLSEVPIGAALVGPTLVRLFTDQFKALMTGDRFFYEYEGEEKKRVEMKKITMAHIVCRNTALTTVNKEAFLKTSTSQKCNELFDMNFCPWKDTTGVKWSAWTTLPCMNNIQIQFRTCLDSDKYKCECDGVPFKTVPCSGNLAVATDPADLKKLEELVNKYYRSGNYTEEEALKKAVKEVFG